LKRKKKSYKIRPHYAMPKSFYAAAFVAAAGAAAFAPAFAPAGADAVPAAGVSPGAVQVGVFPVIVGLTLAHLAVAGAPLNVRSTLFSSTVSHGTPLLQIKITPS
jgi:hypothetical protein